MSDFENCKVKLPTYVIRTDRGKASEYPNADVIDKMKRLKCCKDDDCNNDCISKPGSGDECEEFKKCIAKFDRLKIAYTKESKLNLKTRSSSFSSYYKPNPSRFPDTPPKDFECYNYVIGISKDITQFPDPRMLMRLGKFNEDSFFDLVSCYVNKVTSTATQESICGIKHIQMASVDMEILFSGVLLIDRGHIIITPMSGTYIDNVLSTLKENPDKYSECIECVSIANKPENLGKLMKGTLEENLDCKYDKKDTGSRKRIPAQYKCDQSFQETLVSDIELYNFINIICTEYALLNLYEDHSTFTPYYFQGKHNGNNCFFTSEYAKVPPWVKSRINSLCLDKTNDPRCTQDIPQILNIQEREQRVKDKVKEALTKPKLSKQPKQLPQPKSPEEIENLAKTIYEILQKEHILEDTKQEEDADPVRSSKRPKTEPKPNE